MVNDQLISRELPIYDMFGNRWPFTIRELMQMKMAAAFTAFATLTVAILVLTDMHGFTSEAGIPLAAFVWTVCLLVYFFGYTALIAAFGALQTITGEFRIWLPIISVIVVTADTFLTELHLRLYTNAPFDPDQIAWELPINILLAFCFEAAYYWLVMPQIFIALRAGSAPTESITIADRTFMLKDLLYVETEEHYLHFHTRHGDHLVRARMKDLLAQMNDEDGIQAHRSFWVSKGAISTLVRHKRGDQLTLIDGTRIPVARARAAQVRAWMADHQQRKAEPLSPRRQA